MKRGQFELTLDELDQARNYAVLLHSKGHVTNNTKIEAYVLGSSVANEVAEITHGENIRIKPLTYTVVLRKAHARTFNLIKKIKEVKNIQDDDKEIRKLISPDKTVLDYIPSKEEII